MATADRLGTLDLAKCYRLLATQTVGRVVYTDGALPAVAPVNYALDGHRIIFRTSPMSGLALGVVDQVVAFEVDCLDAEVRTGWSVVVTGFARALNEAGELSRAAALHLSPWAGGTRELFVCITPGVVTGRFVAS